MYVHCLAVWVVHFKFKLPNCSIGNCLHLVTSIVPYHTPYWFFGYVNLGKLGLCGTLQSIDKTCVEIAQQVRREFGAVR